MGEGPGRGAHLHGLLEELREQGDDLVPLVARHRQLHTGQAARQIVQGLAPCCARLDLRTRSCKRQQPVSECLPLLQRGCGTGGHPLGKCGKRCCCPPWHSSARGPPG